MRPLPATPEGAAIGLERPARSLVPSSWFCTTSTACSARSLRACCIPLPTSPRRLASSGWGSSRFPGASPTSPSDRRGPFPATRITPFEGVPPSAAVSTSPWSLPPCRSPRRAVAPPLGGSTGLEPKFEHAFASLVDLAVSSQIDPLGTRGESASWPCSADGSVTSTTVAGRSTSSPSLGFVPCRGLSPAAHPSLRAQVRATSRRGVLAAGLRRLPCLLRFEPRTSIRWRVVAAPKRRDDLWGF